MLLRALVTVSLVSLLAATTGFAETGAARLATFVKDGQTYFALSLQPALKADPAQQNDVIVLVDTSASQAGRYREAALAALDSLLANLGPQDRVQLVAVDSRAVPLTTEFAAAGDSHLQAALAKLRGRAPLGATDLDAGLRSATGLFRDSGRARSIIYLGDALSKANLFTADAFARLVNDLQTQRVSVSGYAVGRELNGQLLAALANQTGGMLLTHDDALEAPATAGRALAQTVHGGVLWPTALKLSESVGVSFPSRLPPLRTDRDSILIGKLTSAGDVRVAISGEVNGRIVEIRYDAVAEKPSDDFSFLPKLVELAAADRGLSLPTVGTAGLRAAAHSLQASADQLAQLGHAALSSGNYSGAAQVAAAALARDPGHPTARAIQSAARREPALALAGGVAEELKAEPPGFLAAVSEERSVLAGKIRAEVENVLAAARQQMAANPNAAEQSLKLAMEQVERSPNLDASYRSQLRQQLAGAIRLARQAASLAGEAAARKEEKQAASSEQERVGRELAVRELRLKQLMDRFDFLMDEGRYQVADEEISPQIERLAANSPLESSVLTAGRSQRAAQENQQVWRHRENNYVRTMASVESSLVPFPDEPPIVYLPAAQWEDLSLRRAKYKAVDLRKSGSSEQRIFDELGKVMPVGLEFVETPLKEAIQFIQDQHNVPIVIDAKTLTDAGLTIDTPVTKSLKGITLRSALRLLLKDLDLTYVVRDEVLQITTPDKAAEQVTTKVYPVGDLVVPIGINSNLFGLGGVGGLNGGGGQGGGFGGGNQFGGGGFGGGNQFGGGGNQFGGGNIF